MLAAFAEASAILESEDYLEIAKKNADFILENMQKDGYLLRTWKDGRGEIECLSGRLREFCRRFDRTLSGFGRSEIFDAKQNVLPI